MDLGRNFKRNVAIFKSTPTVLTESSTTPAVNLAKLYVFICCSSLYLAPIKFNLLSFILNPPPSFFNFILVF